MYKSKLIPLLLILLLYISCKSNMNYTDSDTIHSKSISLFCKTNLFNKDKVFAIDTLSINEEIISVSIGEFEPKFLINLEEDRYEKGKLPVCIERNNSLFYWYDKNHVATDEEILMLQKYNLLAEDTLENLVYVYDSPIDDEKKGLDIYFCKNNYNKYKKIKTNFPTGYYTPPKLDCSE